VLHIDDATSDAGVQAPVYADAVAVDIVDTGSSVSVTVRLNGPLPKALASGEVEGIGVNLTPTDASATSYQLFADGESDGWFGYLEVGDHFIAYPGTLDRSGASIVFVVPWSSLDNLRTGTVDAFVDWSKPSSLTAARSSSDRMPNNGTAAFAR
jgi:hypothetical protein